MEILLLGTAAAEGWPAPYCVCPACEKARLRKGPDIRTRSGALIDNELKIDFSPDTVMQMQRAGRNLCGVKTLLFTHQHSDHFAPAELEWAKPPFTLTPGPKIELCANAEVMAGIATTFGEEGKGRLPYNYRTFKAGDHFTTTAGDEVWAMPANHCPGATLLRIRRKKKTIFYGHDTGPLLPAVLNQLADGIPLDLVLLDCTYGNGEHNNSHLGVKGVLQSVANLRERIAITKATRIIATHFSHGGQMMHDELTTFFQPHNISVAHDNMTIEL